MRTVIAILLLCASAAADDMQIRTTGPATITIEDSGLPSRESGNPLPRIGSWNTGENQTADGQDAGYTPDFQLQQIDSGVPWGPTFELFWPSPAGFNNLIRASKPVYFEPLWSECKARKLPLVFVGQDFAALFRELNAFRSVDAIFVRKADGTFVLGAKDNLKVASPYGPPSQWYALGQVFGRHLAAAFAADYPDPPCVLLMDNSEYGDAEIPEARQDSRCPAVITNAYSKLTSQQAKHLERYEFGKRKMALGAEFKRGLRDALPDGWKHIQWIAYSQFGNEFAEADYQPDSLRYAVPWADASGAEGTFQRDDGRTANIGYFHNWSAHQPGIVKSPQMESGNARFAADIYHRSVNPEYLIETHFWNGRNHAANVYLGCVRCVMWQMQSEWHRAFVGSSETRAATWAKHLEPLAIAATEVHDSDTLRRFWQHGTLLNNLWSRDFGSNPKRNQYDTATGYGHPYNQMLPAEYADTGKRLFLQHVPINNRLTLLEDPPYSRMIDNWTIDREHKFPVKVFAICLQLGDEHLIYAHAPGGGVRGVEIQVCGDGPAPRFSVIVDVPVAGAFWRRKADGAVEPVK